MAPTTTIVVPAGKKVSVQITPLGTPEPLIGRCAGACGAEVTPYLPNDFLTGFMRPKDMVSTTNPTQAELLALESQLRDAALAQSDFYLLGLNAVPAIAQLLPRQSEGHVQRVRRDRPRRRRRLCAEAGIAIGAVAGVETGPGLVLTAIGGGVIGGVARYFGGNWIADWLFEN